MKILVDADYIVYKSCAAAESEVDFSSKPKSLPRLNPEVTQSGDFRPVNFCWNVFKGFKNC